VDRSRALEVVRVLGLTRALDEHIYRLTSDADAVVRSLAVAMLADLDGPTARRIVWRALNDPDSRVQSNAIEVLDRLPVPTKGQQLEAKLKSTHQRVRATAIAALLKLQAGDAAEALLEMLYHPSGAHRISALWVVERLALASVMHRLEEMAETDPDARVRRRAQRVLRGLPSWPEPVEPAATPPDRCGLSR
jgi:HEAT repeat protein